MIDLFKKPLPWNDKVGKSQMVSEELPADPAGGDQQAGVKTQLLGALKRSARDSDQSATSTQGGVRKPSRATQAPLRPARSTRATVLLHDREAYKEKEVERYSLVHGLGRAWSKQVRTLYCVTPSNNMLGRLTTALTEVS